MAIDLSGCRAKVNRAHELRHALQDTVSPDIEADELKVQLSAEFHPEPGYYLYRVAVIPDEWRLRVGVVIGDIVHNLRSALDHLVWQLVLDHGGEPPRKEWTRIKFPIEDTGERFAQAYTLKKISSSHGAILGKLQPYEGGYVEPHPLVTLRELSNRDKHRVLTPLLLRSEGVKFNFGLGNPLDFRGMPKHLEVGTEVVRAWTPTPHRGRKVEVAGYVAPHVMLPEGNDTAIRGAIKMIAYAERALNKFI